MSKPIVSTLDVLDVAKDRGMIPDVRKALDRLIRSGFRLKRTLYNAKLRDAGEHP
jgi:predicted nucleic acid-binding protein